MEEIEHDVSLPLKNAGHSMHPKAENARGGGGRGGTKLKSKFPCLKKKN